MSPHPRNCIKLYVSANKTPFVNLYNYHSFVNFFSQYLLKNPTYRLQVETKQNTQSNNPTYIGLHIYSLIVQQKGFVLKMSHAPINIIQISSTSASHKRLHTAGLNFLQLNRN